MLIQILKNLWSKEKTGIFLFAYILCVVFYTLFSRAEGFFEAHYDLFWSYKMWIHGDAQMGWEIVLNIALFMPVGFMLAAWKNEWSVRRRLCWSVVLCCLISVGIEVSQLVFRLGTFEFDDILNNTVGGAAGCLCYFLFIKIAGIDAIHRLIRTDINLNRIISGICCLFVIVAVLECATTDKSQTNYENWFSFQLDDVQLIDDQITLSGFCFGYEYSPVTHLELGDDRFDTASYELILQSTADQSEVELDVKRGLSRPDVNEYYSCEADYTAVGFTATADASAVSNDTEYEVIVCSDGRTINTGTYIRDGLIEYFAVADSPNLDVRGTDLEEIVNNGYLRVYRSDKHCAVYQYDGDLYWIVDSDFDFESDGSTYIQYQLHTTQPDNIPIRRTINDWYWDNIGFNFESREITGDINCGKYRVATRRLPTEYSIASIVTGYHKDGKWIWQEYFRPILSGTDLNVLHDKKGTDLE